MNSSGKIRYYGSLLAQGAKAAWKMAWRITAVRVYAILALVANALNWFGSWLLYRAMGPNLTVLHYNVDFGIDLVGQRQKLFWNPAIGLIFIVLDFIFLLVWLKRKESSLVYHILMASAVLVNGFLLLALLAVYLINFY